MAAQAAPAAAAAPAPAADEARDRAADPQAQRASKHRYRTVIPAPSGNYAFVKTIGQGSMGKVKLAKKEGSNEYASFPLLLFDLFGDGSQLTNNGIGAGRVQDHREGIGRRRTPEQGRSRKGRCR
jgi:hypothetical protein